MALQYKPESHSKQMHGDSGPLEVSKGEGAEWSVLTEMSERFREAVIQSGLPVSDDVNDCLTLGGSHWRKWISQKTGKRQDVPHHYLHNKPSANIEIVTEAVVDKLILTNGTDGSLVATGASVVDTASGKAFTVTAKRQVILSAGPLNSPAILERSGVGKPDLLQSLGIDVQLANENVGEGFQDHSLCGSHFFVDPKVHNNDKIVWGNIFGLGTEDQDAANKLW